MSEIFIGFSGSAQDVLTNEFLATEFAMKFFAQGLDNLKSGDKTISTGALKDATNSDLTT